MPPKPNETESELRGVRHLSCTEENTTVQYREL